MASNHFDLPRLAAGEAATVPFDVDEDVTGWTFAARVGPGRGLPPWVQKTTGGSGAAGVVTDPGTGGTGYFILTAADTGRTLGPGVWAWSLWRTDTGLEARLAWGDLVLGKSVGPRPTGTG